MKTIAATAIAASLLAVAGNAQAGPFYTEEELFEMADIVIEAEVVDNACLNASEDDVGVHRTYGHTLSTLEVLKGEVSDILDYRIVSTEYSPEYGEAGCSAPDYVLAQGWIGRLYLNVVGDDQVTVTDWGGAVQDVEASHMDDLPACEPAAEPINDDPPDLNPPDGGGDMRGDGPVASGCSASGTAPADASWMALGLLGLAVACRRRRSGT